MRRLLVSVLGIFAATASLVAQSSVWKVTRGSQTLYLGGTVHVMRVSDFPLPEEFNTAFDLSTKLVFETDIGRIKSPEMFEMVAKHGMFTDDTTLDKVLTPEAWKRVENFCEQSGMPLAQVSRLKPWLFTLTVATIELHKLGVSTEGVDVHFYKKALEAQKKTGELESFEKQVEFITQLGAGQESEMVQQTLEDVGELPEKIEGMINAWKIGDLAKLDELMVAELRTKYPAIFKTVLVSRNRTWVPKIDALLKTPEVEFVLVGAGHLPGKDGLLTLLRARGCTIEQLNAPRR